MPESERMRCFDELTPGEASNLPANGAGPETDSDIARLQRAVRAFVAERDWEKFHDPKNLAMAIAVESGELMEHFRWLSNDRSLAAMGDPRTRSAVQDEVADVAILLLEFAAICDIDIKDAVEAKLAKNAERYPLDRARGRAEKYDRI